MTEEEKSESFLGVKFVDVGSVVFENIQVSNLTPLQMLAFAAFLEVEAKSRLAEEREMRKVQVPKQGIVVPGK